MEDITLDYITKKYRIKEYTALKPSTKFTTNEIFIDKIKNKKVISYSDNSYVYDNCYPNYLYSDSTNIKINNSAIGNFDNLNDIITNLDTKNNYSTSFVRGNSVIDLS
jgi:hypothetical protein